MARPKRKDKSRTVLRTGELQRSDGSYRYSWTDENHKRRYVYAKTLEALRIKEEAIEKDKSDGIKAEARYITINDLYELWICLLYTSHIKMDTQISDYVLPFVIRDIFGNEYGQFEQNKEKFWGLFYFYKEKIMEDIDAMKVDLLL